MKTAGIATLVEGHGEINALPLLIRRIVAEIDASVVLDVPKGFRHPSGNIRKAGGIERAVSAVAHLHQDHSILVLIDCEDDCPAELGPELLLRVRQERADLRVSVVLAYREFETWFLASAESLSGKRNLEPGLEPPPDPEAVRGAKEWLSKRTTGPFTYRPTQDQCALTEQFDMKLAHSRSRSFRKLWKEIESLIR